MPAAAPLALVKVVVFEAAGQWFGLRSAAVREVHRAVTLSMAPGLHPAVVGAFNLRGARTFAIDPRVLIGRATEAPRTTDHLVVFDSPGGPAALLVDRCLGLVDLPDPDTTSPAQAGGSEAATRALGSFTPWDLGLVLILDPARVAAAVKLPAVQASAGDGREEAT
jgi:chemotaxis signal transduction protein